MSIIIIIGSILINLIIFCLFSRISKFIKLYDFPDNNRKNHDKPIASIGGLIILINIIYISIFYFVPTANIFNDTYFLGFNDYLSFAFIPIALLIIGFFDDKYNLSAKSKLFLITIVLLIILKIDSDLRIDELRFSFLEFSIILFNFDIIFSIMCVMLFINAMNMIDGINLLCASYLMMIFIILAVSGVSQIILILLIIGIIGFLFLNYIGACFLGDNGSIYLSYLAAYFIIKSYNYEYIFFADELFILMMVPGIDMIRVSFVRLLNKKSPFNGDRSHIHHIFRDRYGKNKSIFLLLIIFFLPFIFNTYLENSILIIITSVIIYFIIIYVLRKSNSN